MTWVLVAISLHFSQDGQVLAAQSLSRHETKIRCEQMLAIAKAEIARSTPKAQAVLQCVQLKREPNA